MEVVHPMIDVSRLATYLQNKRRQDNLTLEETAQQCGVSASTLSRIETSKTGFTPTLGTLKRIADWLGLSVETFLIPPPASSAEAAHSGNGQRLERVEAFLRADKNLSPEGAEALIQLIHAAYTQLARGK
jgi:transcriptional regulator with XRE-family HTH domain